MKKFKFDGVISALPTPFYNGKVDFDSLEKVLEFQIKNGIDGFVVNGTTAESPTLHWSEVEEIYKFVKKYVKDEIPVIVGAGSNSTEHAIDLTLKCNDLGADAILSVVPYYNKPPQRGLVLHFEKIAQKSKCPVIVYNVPGRTITSISMPTFLELSKINNIIGIKEASGDVPFFKALFQNLTAETNLNWTLLSGDDPTYLQFLLEGGNGIISVMSNALTKECERWKNLIANKDLAIAQADFAKYSRLIQLMYVEANPIPIKWILNRMGIFKSPEMRLPLVELDKKYFLEIETELKNLNLIG